MVMVSDELFYRTTDLALVNLDEGFLLVVNRMQTWLSKFHTMPAEPLLSTTKNRVCGLLGRVVHLERGGSGLY